MMGDYVCPAVMEDSEFEVAIDVQLIRMWFNFAEGFMDD